MRVGKRIVGHAEKRANTAGTDAAHRSPAEPAPACLSSPYGIRSRIHSMFTLLHLSAGVPVGGVRYI